MSTVHFNQTTTPTPGKGVLGMAFVNSIKAIETRNNRSPA
jgi:hypothetical protein